MVGDNDQFGAIRCTKKKKSLVNIDCSEYLQENEYKPERSNTTLSVILRSLL